MNVIKRTLSLFGLVMLVLALMAGMAWAEGVSCGDLTRISEAVDNVAVILEDGGLESVTQGSSADKALMNLVNSLRRLADIEGSEAVSHNVSVLEEAWDDMDSETFLEFLDAISENLMQLHERDC